MWELRRTEVLAYMRKHAAVTRITGGEIEIRVGFWSVFLPRKSMYNRTQNKNGSFNTRCLDCFMTIASCVETETELEERETHHMCPEKALAQLMALERADLLHAARN